MNEVCTLAGIGWPGAFLVVGLAVSFVGLFVGAIWAAR
jgi:hypothetical protein